MARLNNCFVDTYDLHQNNALFYVATLNINLQNALCLIMLNEPGAKAQFLSHEMMFYFMSYKSRANCSI